MTIRTPASLLLAFIIVAGIFISGIRTDAATFPAQRIVTVGPNGADFTTIQAAIDSITDSSATNWYTVLIDPGVYEVGNATDTYAIKMRGTSGTVDYISLVGKDRDGVVIQRSASPNIASPVIEGAKHMRLANLTITSPVSRLVHWDLEPNTTFTAENLYLPLGGGGAGISTGLHANSKMTIQNCEFGSAVFATHNAAGTEDAQLNLIGNIFAGNPTEKIVIDMTTGTNTITTRMAGNVASWGGYGASVWVVKLQTSPALKILTDFPSGLVFRAANEGELGFWNSIYFPQLTTYPQTTVSALNGDVLVLSGKTVGRTTVEGDLWPVVAIEGGGTIGASPRLATGPYAEVNMDAAAVAIGDTIITSSTAGLATANNQQTDVARILGIATTAKAAGAGRVVVRLAHGAR